MPPTDSPIRVLWHPTMGRLTMNSACDGMTLSDIEASVVQNWRVSARGLKVRYPYVKQTATSITGYGRGGITCTLNGKKYRFIAVQNGQYTNVYQSTGTTWTQITNSAGAYGDSRLTTPSSDVPTGRSTNNATFAQEMNWVSGTMVGSSLTVGGLTSGTTYFVNRASATSYSFHTNLQDALNGTNAVTLSGTFNTPTITPELSNFVSFQVIRETATGDPGGGAMYGVSGRDLVMISDGAKNLVYDVAGTAASQQNLALHINAWHPGRSKVRQEYGWSKYLNMDTTTVVPTVSDADVTATDNTAHPDTGGTTPTITFTTAADTNDWGKFDFTGGGGAGSAMVGGNQFHILYDCPIDRFLWDKVKVQVSADDSTYYTVYTPGTDSWPIVTDADRGFRLASFPLDANAVPPSTTVKYIKFTYTPATSPSVNIVIYFLGFYGGGSIQGGTLFRTAYYNQGSRAESIGVDCDDKGGRNISFMGCQDSRNYIKVPGNPLVNYSYFVTFQTPSTANRDTGLDYFLLYARAPGSSVFLYTTSQVIAQVSGTTWSYTTVGGVSQSALGDITKAVDSVTYYSRRAPDGQNMAAPPFKSCDSIGGRVFLGNCLSQTTPTDTASDVYFSEQDHPFRFRDVLAYLDNGVPDPSSGGRVTLPGERVMQVKAMMGDNSGVGAVLIWTEQALHKIEGPDAFQLTRTQRMVPYGTHSPNSAAVYQDRVVWLDDTQQIRVFGPGVYAVPSKDRMDNITSVIPRHRLSHVWGNISQDVYRMAYTVASGAVNTVMILYDFAHDAFMRDAPLVSPSIQFGRFEKWNGVLYNHTEDLSIYKCDDTSGSQDTDGVTPAGIVPQLQLREFHDQGDHEFQFGRVGIIFDTTAATNMEAFWTDKDGNTGPIATTSSLISLATGTVIKKWSTPGNGLKAFTAYPTIKGVNGTGIPPGKQLYAVVGEVIMVPGDKYG